MSNLFKRNYIIISLILFLTGTFYDFNISSTLINQNSLFGLLMAGYGVLPIFVGLIVSGFIIYFNYSKWLGGLFISLSYIGSIFFAVENGIKLNIYLLGVINLIVYGWLGYYLYLKIKDERDILKKLFFILGVIALQYAVVHLIKYMWLRPRMKLIINSDVIFLPWYVKGKAIKYLADFDLILSFPSGHTSGAACALILLYFNNNKFNKIFSIVWIVLVALSRIIIGAHFLSDVVMGGFITFLCCQICNYGLNKLNCVNVCESIK